MVSERYCDSLQNEGSTTWNGEETVKLWVKTNHKLFPEIVTWHANWLVYYSMCQGPFFHHKGAFNKKCASVSWNLAVTSWNVLSQGIGAHILFPSWSSFWVLKNKFLWFSHRNTQLSLYVWSQKIVTKGALYFQFLGIPTIRFIGMKQLVWKVANILEKLRFLWKCEIWGNILKIWYFVNNCLIEAQILKLFRTCVTHIIVIIWSTAHFVST